MIPDGDIPFSFFMWACYEPVYMGDTFFETVYSLTLFYSHMIDLI